MRILLTGANGFVGIEAVRQLAAAGHTVLAVDSLRYCPWRFEADAEAGVIRVQLDLREREQTASLIQDFRPEAIIHLAAIHFIPECENKPDEAVSINVEATVNLLSACQASTRFVFASTAAVYAPSDTAHREDGAIGPMDVYGYTKLAAEHLIRYYADKTGFEAVVIRLFNVVGPGETNPHILPEIIRQFRAGTRTLRLGNTTPKRDYIHVSDAAAGFIAVATQPMPAGERIVTANLGSGSEYSVDEIVAKFGEALGEPITIEIDPAKVRKSDRPHLLSDNSRLRAAFCWSPRNDVDASIRETWADPRMLDQLL